MIEGRRRVLNVLAVVEAVREAHPGLRRPLTAESLSAVLRAERIRVMRLPIAEKAYVIGLPPAFTIVLSSERSPRYHTRWAAHELGHVKLHFGAGVEIAKQITPCGSDDPRELEAELFARCLLVGEAATPEHPRIAPVAAALSTGEMLRRRPIQIDLEFPIPAPIYRTVVGRSEFQKRLEAAYEDSLAYGEQRRVRRGLPAVTHRESPTRQNDDLTRLGYDDAMKAPWFRDVADRKWWIFNLARRTVDGKPEWERLLDSMSPEISHRLFLSGAGERRLYAFRDRRESRAHRVKHLDRQIANAVRLRRRRGSPAGADGVRTQTRTTRAFRENS